MIAAVPDRPVAGLAPWSEYFVPLLVALPERANAGADDGRSEEGEEGAVVESEQAAATDRPSTAAVPKRARRKGSSVITSVGVGFGSRREAPATAFYVD
jgi:hypothetical protein